MPVRRGRIDRYLLTEAAEAWLGVTLVLLLIMLSTRFVNFLSAATVGELPRNLLLQVVALSSLQYLVILIPVSLLLGMLLALGRLYKDHEITAMAACGVGIRALYRPFGGLAVILALLTGLLAFQIGPWAGRETDRIVKDAKRLVQFVPFEAGHFREVGGGRASVYTESVDPASGGLGTVFIAVADPEFEGIVTARSGTQRVHGGSGEREVKLRDGWRISGEPGRADFEVVHFEEYGTRLSPPDFLYVPGKRKIAETGELLVDATAKDWAELHWRLAAPLSVLLLAFLAVPLAHVSPRQGRYGKVVVGIVLYLVYSSLLGLGQSLIGRGIVSPALGLWWVHALVFALAMFLVARRAGWVRPR